MAPGARSSGLLESNLRRTTTHVKRGDFLTHLATSTVADDNELPANFRHCWIKSAGRGRESELRGRGWGEVVGEEDDGLEVEQGGAI